MPAWPTYKGDGGRKLNSNVKCEESAKRDSWDLGGKACKEAIEKFNYTVEPRFYDMARDSKIVSLNRDIVANKLPILRFRGKAT